MLAHLKRATLNGRALISFLIGLISVSDIGDHVGQEKDIFTMVRWLPTNIVGGGDCRGGRGGGEVFEWWDLLGQRVEILHGGLHPPLIGPQHLSQGGRCGWLAAAQGGGSPTLAGGDGGRGRGKSCRHSFGPNPHRSSISREDTPVLNNSRACLPPSPPPPTTKEEERARPGCV